MYDRRNAFLSLPGVAAWKDLQRVTGRTGLREKVRVF